MARQMKDSGIDWLGEIPADWLCRKLKTVLVANDGGIWGNDPVGNESDKVVIRSTEQTVDGKWSIDKPATRNLSSIDYSKARIEKDDLLITKSSGSDLHIGKTTLADDYFTNHECYFSNFLQRIRCSGYSPKLLWYLFNSLIIRAQCVYLQNSTSGLGNINTDIIGNLYIPVPPLDEQQRIADFLDEKCARIDSVVAKTRASIDEYRKLKQSVITRAVTKGIRPNRQMKDSGIEWIGEIPADWTLAQLKRFAFINNGRETLNEVDKTATAVPVYGSGGVFKYTTVPLYEGEVVMFGRKGTLGKPIYTNEKFWTVDTMYYLTFSEKLSAKFAYYQLVAFDWEPYITQTALPSIVASEIVACRFAFPPLDEQQRIADFLDEKTAAIDSLITKKNQLVSELESLKKSLIFEYVTGKKEVVT